MGESPEDGAEATRRTMPIASASSATSCRLAEAGGERSVAKDGQRAPWRPEFASFRGGFALRRGVLVAILAWLELRRLGTEQRTTCVEP